MREVIVVDRSPESKPEQFEVTGVMLAFNGTKDHCFLVPVGLEIPDVLLRRSTLIQGGVLEIPPQNARIRCLVENTEKGPLAVKVFSVAKGLSAQDAVPETIHGPEKMFVKFFDPRGKFGFFTRADGTDVHVRLTTLEKSGIKWAELTPEREFLVTYKPGRQGFSAVNVTR